MARRGENIYKRKDGRWEGRYIKGRHSDNRIYYGYVYARTYRELKEKLYEMKKYYENNYFTSNELQWTVSKLLDNWMLNELPLQVKPSTLSSYRYKVTKYILPYIGDISIKKLTKNHLQHLIHQLLEEGLSVSTIRLSIQIFKSAFNSTNGVKHLYTAIFQGLHYPFCVKKKIRALSKQEQKGLEQEAMKTEQGLPILLALNTGLRIGEISALKWTDINFEKKELTVTRTLQRIFSTRTQKVIPQTEIHEGLVKSTASHRKIPLNEKILRILKNQEKTSDYVVGKKGHFFEPRTLTYQFKKIARVLNLQNFHFHQLRHTFATRLLELGADISSVSSLLGHQSVKMTLDIYTDSLMSQRKKWIRKLS
ncbi:hypothetical protein BAU15_03450 [Enterococcus sp. JM4C]|uniref:tyrosine-type recombinase/integrase n=1 Tax=Candidatus Enterococcus huntleyi TaxID=1857217 RepID=UPI00137957C7|nr:site-specific integrase [Enterococcus sp. JM4C]KAF1295610.1 hypothetical protein BAU15_03450 [Enterococcus sp. JM4C]